MSDTITREQAEAALDAVKAQYAKQITPTDWSGHEHDPGLTGAALAHHLTSEHGYDADMLIRKAARGKSPEDVHAAAHEPEAMYPVLPVLVEDYSYDGQGYAIAWEEGPDEWVFTLNGGSGEGDRVLMASAAKEFGFDVDTAVKSVERPAAVFPPGVRGEPINHIVLGLYPA